MEQPPQSPAATLPAELIFHILRFSLEEINVFDSAGDREALFRFGPVCRAWCTANLAWPRLGVVSAEEATALASKLERDALERRKAASGRTTRRSAATWIRTPPRELVVIRAGGVNSKAQKASGALVRACPELAVLTLVVETVARFDPLLAELQHGSRGRATAFEA